MWVECVIKLINNRIVVMLIINRGAVSTVQSEN